MRIHFTYKHVDKPWGGANNLIRALRAELEQRGEFEFTNPDEAPTDVMFMNQLGQGPAGPKAKISLRAVGRYRLLDDRKLVVRAVNLNAAAFRAGPRNLILGRMRDRRLLRLLDLADLVIFQSAYQRAMFAQAGYRGNRDVVIHNGAGSMYWNDCPTAVPVGETLRIVSATASPRATKRHDLIAAVSRIPGVHVSHFGAWPDRQDSADVELLGMRTPTQMAAYYRDAHFFLHPAVKDPCPNVLFEAICSGLPVIYCAEDSSSPEIVGENGLPLDLSDLAGTMDEARLILPALREKLYASRSHYRIDRTTADYIKAFERAYAS